MSMGDITRMFREGKQSALEGKPTTACRYKEGSYEHREWLEGHDLGVRLSAMGVTASTTKTPTQGTTMSFAERILATKIQAVNQRMLKQQEAYKAELLKILKGFEKQNSAMKVGQGSDKYESWFTIHICQDPNLETRFTFDNLEHVRAADLAAPWPSIKTQYMTEAGRIIHYETATYGLKLNTLQNIRQLKTTFPQYAEKVIKDHTLNKGRHQYGHD